MSLVTIAAPFVDTSADSLRWRLDAAPVPALASRLVEVAGVRVDLRILGASHQVIVDGRLGEVVACGAHGEPLSPRVADATPWQYDLDATVLRTSRDDLAHRVAQLVGELEGRDDAIVAAFPGRRDAVTAIAVAGGDGIGWRTWHAYPQSGELVATTTRLTRP